MNTMKSLAILLPHRLDEEGNLTIDASASFLRILNHLKCHYRITLILRQIRQLTYHALPEGFTILYDTALPVETVCTDSIGFFQHWYHAWSQASPLAGTYDCVISGSATSPWCMDAVLRRVSAKRRLLFFPHDPCRLLTFRDIPVFIQMCSHVDCLLCATQAICRSVASLCGDRVLMATAHPPADLSSVSEQAALFIETPFEEDQINLVTCESLCSGTRAELIPIVATQLTQWQPSLRWYIFGKGERSAHLLQEIIAHDVCEQVIPVEDAESPMGCIPWCSGVVALHDENEEAAAAASLLNIPLFVMDEDYNISDLTQWVASLSPSIQPHPLPDCTWKDKQLWKFFIEGESHHED